MTLCVLEATGEDGLVHLMPRWLLWGPSRGDGRTTKNRQDSRRDALPATAAHRWRDNGSGRRGHLVRPHPAVPAWRLLDCRPSCCVGTAHHRSGASGTRTEERKKRPKIDHVELGSIRDQKDKYSAVIIIKKKNTCSTEGLQPF